MGFDSNGVKLLLAARKFGVSFEKVATIGRQLFFLDLDSLKHSLEIFGINKSDSEVNRIFIEENGYCEGLLRMLGASETYSIDISDYEGASLIHDMNNPINESLKNAFTVVIDSGSLEHIFNISQALKNCMEMVRLGGHFISISPTNNFMGHGFYQLSPEFFFSTLTENNGFSLEKVIFFENLLNPCWYEILSPMEMKSRVGIMTLRQAYLFVCARKIEMLPIFSVNPQQSDYQISWAGSNEGKVRGERKRNNAFKQTKAWLVKKFDTFRDMYILYNLLFRYKKPFMKKISLRDLK